jgi:hypothetical protein
LIPLAPLSPPEAAQGPYCAVIKKHKCHVHARENIKLDILKTVINSVKFCSSVTEKRFELGGVVAYLKI